MAEQIQTQIGSVASTWFRLVLSLDDDGATFFVDIEVARDGGTADFVGGLGRKQEALDELDRLRRFIESDGHTD